MLPGSNAVSVYLLFGVPSPSKMDSTNGTHIPGISRAPTNATIVVGKLATAADRGLHSIPVVDALPTLSACVDIFHMDPSNSRDSVERRVRKHCLMNRVDLVQLGGHVTNPEDPYTVVRDRGGNSTARATGRTCHSLRPNRVASKVGRILETHHFVAGQAEWKVTVPSAICCGSGS